MASFLPFPVRLTAAPPDAGTFQMSQPSESSIALLSLVQPSAGRGGFTTLWSSSVLTNEAGTSFVTFADWPDAMSYRK